MRPSLALLSLTLPGFGLAGCRGFVRDTGPWESCDPGTVEPGRVRARRMPCDDEGIDGGEGRRADYLIENAWARFVIRQPGSAATLLELAGGTVVDAAPPEGEDILLELVPLVDGGWLSSAVVDYGQEPDEAWIRITGVPAPLPFPVGWHGDASQQVEVTYRLGPDDRALRIEGADGAWLMPQADATLAGATARVGDWMLAIDGVAEDQGGGVLVRGGARLAAGDPSTVMAAVWPGGATVSGHCGCDGVEVLAGATPVGWLPADAEGAFAGTVPAGADGLRALAEGHAPGAVVPAGEAVELPLGGEGWLGVRVVDRFGVALPALVTAIDAHGRRERWPVEPEGRWLPLGAGHWQLEADAGPLYTTERTTRTLAGASEWAMVVDGDGAPEGWVLADLSVETWPSHRDRRSAEVALAQAAARGVAFAVVGAPDEVATASWGQPWDASLRAASGSWAVSADQGTVVAWPVSANRRKPAHGAVGWEGLIAEDILRAAAGSSDQQRLLVVDPAWLEAAGPPLGWDPRPDMLRLDSFDDLDLALALFDAWLPIALAGPATWVRLGHDDRFANEEVERALLTGHTVAGTGPFLDLAVDGAVPGERLTGRGPRVVTLGITAPRDRPLAGAGLIVDGAWAERWDLDGLEETERLRWRGVVSSERYVLAVAWGPDDLPGRAWAVTSPVWTGRP